MPDLYDDLPLYASEPLAVGDGHVLQVHHAGNPQGQPVLLLHGGPGSGQSPVLRRAFDPRHYHLIAPDQRGAGHSTPAGGTAHNTLPHLLADLRLLRQHLNLPPCLVVGGSWGATLALAFAADQPEAVSALLLRASFLARDADVAGFFCADQPPADLAGKAGPTDANGPGSPDSPTPASPIAHHFGAAWQALTDSVSLPSTAQGLATLLPALAHALQHGGPSQQQAVALAWWRWEQAQAGLPPPAALPDGAAQAALIGRYRIQSHYLMHGCWLQPTLLQRAATVAARGIPTLLLHADNDRICPPEGARALLHALPQASLRWAPGAGHNPAHPAMASLQRHALDHFARHQRWPTDWPRDAAAAPT